MAGMGGCIYTTCLTAVLGVIMLSAMTLLLTFLEVIASTTSPS
jgi:hypothetical protein